MRGVAAGGVTILVATLAACGSTGPQGFHSATQTYSVREVESAFSAQRLPLSRMTSQPLLGITVLRHGRGTAEVEVSVIGSGGGTLYAPLREFQRSTVHANVAVTFPVADAVPVQAALGELH